MLYFLHGSDATQSRKKLHDLVDSLLKKKPDASVFRMEAEGWDAARFEELLGGQGLFEHKYIVVLDKVFEHATAKDDVLGALKALKESDNVFICLEGDIDAVTVKKLEKHSEKSQKFEEEKTTAKKEFNIFSLTDAFGMRDKKKLWVLYRQAIMSGSEPEEIHGILFWQLKSILTALGSKDAQESGLKPFVFQKAINFAKKYSPEELRVMSAKFVEIYHNARRGISDMETSLERFILSV